MASNKSLRDRHVGWSMSKILPSSFYLSLIWLHVDLPLLVKPYRPLFISFCRYNFFFYHFFLSSCPSDLYLQVTVRESLFRYISLCQTLRIFVFKFRIMIVDSFWLLRKSRNRNKFWIFLRGKWNWSYKYCDLHQLFFFCLSWRFSMAVESGSV